MKRIVISVLIVFLSAAANAASIDGYWEGIGKIPGEELQFFVTFRSDANGVSGTIDIPEAATSGLPLSSVSVSGTKVQFVMVAGGSRIPFDGELAGDTISGTFQFGPHAVPFVMKRSARERTPYQEEEVRFRNFSGTLLLPPSKGPHPLVIFQNAARPVKRDYWRFYADRFTKAGVASLIYDQRADFQVSFEQIAADTLAIIEVLKGRKDIDPNRIGLMAASQGAWIAPLIATRSDDVAFVILVSAPAVTMAKNIQWESESKLRAAKVPADEIPAALALKEKVMGLIRTGAPDEEIDRLIATQKESWAGAIGLPARSDWMRRWFPLVLGLDPVPLWEKVDVPVLAIYGELDQSVRVAESAPLLERALRNNDDVTIETFPKANHGILVMSPSGRPRLAPGYMELMTEWLAKHVEVRKQKE